VVDALFAEPRLAAVYDALDPDRSDLDAYLAIAEELGATRVVDVGCGTGTFACLLAARDKSVVGVDPAAASLKVARRKPGADAVHWVRGDATALPALPALRADLATMTGNVAQVFVDDRGWDETLAAVRASLRAGGWLVFETRDPGSQAWRHWTHEHTYRHAEIPGIGRVETWVELTSVAFPLVSFQTTFVFASDGATLRSQSTLRFRDRNEIAGSLERAGFRLEEVRDAPDRPGLEMVFLAVRAER
jgi:ubiquinone/menaquinone biosynthesis C-methylase UbiE